MPLTSEQFTFIESVDTQIKLLLQHGAHEEQVLIEMLPHMLRSGPDPGKKVSNVYVHWVIPHI